jgi:hypothetical protein
MKYSVEKKELFQVPLPAKTDSYTPVAHYDLVNTIEKNVRSNFKDLKMVSSDYKLNSNGQQFMGMIHLQDTSNPDTELNMSLGFRNSYDKSMSVGLSCGAQVLICSNGMMIGELNLLRKHTSNVWSDVNDLVLKSLDKLTGNFQVIKQDVQQMKTHSIDRGAVNRIVGELFMDEKMITAQQMGIIREQMNFSKNFSMVESGSMTLWNLYNNITESFKIEHPSTLLNKHLNLHNYAKTIVLDAQEELELPITELLG